MGLVAAMSGIVRKQFSCQEDWAKVLQRSGGRSVLTSYGDCRAFLHQREQLISIIAIRGGLREQYKN